MNPQEKGRRRDEAILALVAKFGCLRRSQIQAVAFSGRTAERSCQRRLRSLVKRGKLNRERGPGEQYVYSVGNVGQREHRMAVADLYIRAVRERGPGERIEFQPEYPLSGQDRSDGLLTWHTRDTTYLAFVEVQREGKARLGKYMRYLQSGQWQGAVFPRVVVVGQTGEAGRLTVREVKESVRKAVTG